MAVTASARARVQQNREMMQNLARLMRGSIDTVPDAEGKALFVTTAEVLEGLVRAFYHYETSDDE